MTLTVRIPSAYSHVIDFNFSHRRDLGHTRSRSVSATIINKASETQNPSLSRDEFHAFFSPRSSESFTTTPIFTAQPKVWLFLPYPPNSDAPPAIQEPGLLQPNAGAGKPTEDFPP